MPNPTIFVITNDDVNEIMWIVNNPEPLDIIIPHQGQRQFVSPPKERLDLIKSSLQEHGKIYATYYRPGAFWTEEVFVCPQCRHATLLEFDGVVEESDEWYCKYCYTHWKCSAERGLYPLKPDFDEDG